MWNGGKKGACLAMHRVTGLISPLAEVDLPSGVFVERVASSGMNRKSNHLRQWESARRRVRESASAAGAVTHSGRGLRSARFVLPKLAQSLHKGTRLQLGSYFSGCRGRESHLNSWWKCNQPSPQRAGLFKDSLVLNKECTYWVAVVFCLGKLSCRKMELHKLRMSGTTPNGLVCLLMNLRQVSIPSGGKSFACAAPFL